MDVIHLKEFITISNLLNLTQAAKALHTTQSTLSKHLAQLENELDVQLLLRDRHSMSLTQAGQVVYHKAQLIVELYDSTLHDLEHVRARTGVSVTGLLQNRDIVSLVSRSSMRVGNELNCTISICNDVSVPFFQQLKNGTAAFAFHFDDFKEHGPNSHIVKVPLLREQFVAYVREDHPLASRASVSMADMKDYRFVHLMGNYPQNGWDAIVRACRRHGYSPSEYPIVAVELVDILLQPFGSAILVLQHDLLSANQAATSGLRRIEVVDEDAFFTVCLYYMRKKTSELKPAADIICHTAEQIQEEIEGSTGVETQNSLRIRCKILARDKKLSENERKAMEYYVRGNSLERVGETLGVSRMMAGDLIASVYDKLGIHDRQELVDLVGDTV